ncbi:hypothetical protein [Oceanicola granulosus]|uniref:hypothetical protein n=1 Tax=Oceanicola granulosus TaxID=252302 RepID=UPI0012EA59E8|nr:hypothetical protein [Oceanicola granulosus]
MIHERLEEDEWLTLYLTQLQFPEWSIELHFAYWETRDKLSKDIAEDDVHAQTCKHLKSSSKEYSRPRINKTHLKETSAAYANMNLREFTIWSYEVVKTYLDNTCRRLSDMRALFQEALRREDPEKLLPSTKYANWLRYSYWTPEEAAEFSLGTRDDPRYPERVAAIRNASIICGDDDEVNPKHFDDWARDENWRPFFDKEDIHKMAPDRVDFMPSNRRTNYHKLLLSMAKDKFGYPEGQRIAIKEACERAGLSMDQKTISSILQAADRDIND